MSRFAHDHGRVALPYFNICVHYPTSSIDIVLEAFSPPSSVSLATRYFDILRFYLLYPSTALRLMDTMQLLPRHAVWGFGTFMLALGFFVLHLSGL